MKRIEGHVMTVHQMDLQQPEVRERVRGAIAEGEVPKPS
jgi:hypothetical protein